MEEGSRGGQEGEGETRHGMTCSMVLSGLACDCIRAFVCHVSGKTPSMRRHAASCTSHPVLRVL